MYKPVLPSSLLSEHGEEEFGAFKHEFKNFALKTGVIIKTIEIDDEANQSKNGPEYDVSIYEQDENRGITSTIYKNCIFIDTFGGVADFFESRRRSPTNKKYKSDQDIEKYDGATVLFMCIDGSSEKGIIIGAIGHPNRKKTLSKDAEMHTEAEFNGIRISIDKDGALLITQKTATDNLGKPKKTDNAGSQIKIEKDGAIELNDAVLKNDLHKANGTLKGDAEDNTPSPKEEKSANDIPHESIRIDRPTKKIQITAREDIEVVTDGNHSVTVDKNEEHKIKKDWLIACAEGDALIDIKKGKMGINVKGEFKHKSKTYKSEVEDLFQLKTKQIIVNNTTTLYNSTDLFNIQSNVVNLAAPQVILGTNPAPAVAMTTMFLGIGNLGIPTISLAIGPFSSQVLLSV